MNLHTGSLTRNKRYNLQVKNDDSVLERCSRGQSTPEPVKKYSFGWRRRKQLVKKFVRDSLDDKWIDDKELVDYLMGEELINKIRLLALVSTFDKDLYLKGKEGQQ